MSNLKNIQLEREPTGVESEQADLGRRLAELATKFSAQNLQAQQDFDHTLNDGLDRMAGNLILDSLGEVTVIDRGIK